MFKIKLNDALSAQTIDENGFLIVKDNPIAKAGVFDYLERELNSQSNSEAIVKVCRPFSDLLEKKDLFKGMPIKFEHNWVGDSADDTKADGAIYGDVRADEPYLKADLIIYNPRLIEVIKSKAAVELSPGYECEVVAENGAYNGESYAFKQILKSVNHLAVVEQGRSGKDLKIKDSAKEVNQMKEKTLWSMLKRVLDTDSVAELMAEQNRGDVQADDFLDEILRIAMGEGSPDEKKYAIREVLAKKVEHDKMSDSDSEKDTEKTADENVTEINKKPESENAKSELADDMHEKAEKVDDELDDKETKEVIKQLENVVEKIADSMFDKKIQKFVDSMKSESKKVLDSYEQVKSALGVSFDYSGKTADEIYKYGYETLSKRELPKGADAQTAFNIICDSMPKARVVKAADSKGADSQTSKIDSLLAMYK